MKEVGALLFELHEAYASDEVVNGLASYQNVGRILREQYDSDKGGAIYRGGEAGQGDKRQFIAKPCR